MTTTKADVLIVDDQIDNLRVLSAMLTQQGYKVRKAASGEVAIETARLNPPSLILLDINMPQMNGYEVCSALKQSAETREIPVIFLSALSDAIDKVKAFKIGGTDYITKPFQAEEVLIRVQQQLTIQAQQRQLQQEIQEYRQVELCQARLYCIAQARINELQGLIELKDTFFNTIFHELTNPIANIKLATQLLMSIINQTDTSLEKLLQLESEKHKITQYLDVLRDECEHELQLIRDLLDLQHLETGTQPLEPNLIDIRYWIFNMVQSFELRMQNQQQTLSVELDPNLQWIMTDLFCFSRIITELMNNACKYTPADEVITLSAHVADDMLHLCVINSGVEIPTEKLSAIFDQFYRIQTNDFWKSGGTGLGLTLVKRLVELLSGSIQVVSANQQTCFTVKLPLEVFNKPYRKLSW